ncbi:hypothetical protein IFM89_039910, partial [Coptis chinensis]
MVNRLKFEGFISFKAISVTINSLVQSTTSVGTVVISEKQPLDLVQYDHLTTVGGNERDNSARWVIATALVFHHSHCVACNF